MAKKIRIKPENKGKFNSTKKRTGKSTEELTHSKNPVTRKRAVFAQNAAKKWNHAQDGATMPKQEDFLSLEDYYAAMDAYYSSITDLQSEQERTLIPGIQPNNNPLQTSTSKFQNVLQQAPSTLQSFQNRDMSQPTKMGELGGKKKFNWGQTALTALALTNAVLPQDPIKKPVVYPKQSYNPHPYGTGSQALAEDGITLSKTGYKANSKDRNKPSLRIPSRNITMDNVPHPVLGVDSLGNQQIMMPGENYQFPGEYVDEIPLAKKGKKMKKPGQYISKSYQVGGKIAGGAFNVAKAISTVSKAMTPDPRTIAYNTFINNGINSESAKLMVAQMMHESSDFTSNVYKNNNNPMGMKVPKIRKTPYIKGAGTKAPSNEGKTPYAKFDSLQDAALDLIEWQKYNNIDINNFKTPEEYAEALRQKNYMGTDDTAKKIYIAGINNNLKKLSFEDGGELEQYQQGGQLKPITTTNPNDPRLKAYNDSLSLYNAGEKYSELINKHKSSLGISRTTSNEDAMIAYKNAPKEYDRSKFQPISKEVPLRIWENGEPSDKMALINHYKKPVQPIVYQKPQQVSIKKGQPTYEDSLRLHILADIVQKDYYHGEKTKAVPFSQRPQFSSADAYIEALYGDYTVNAHNIGRELDQLAKKKGIKPYGQYVSVTSGGIGDQFPAYFKKPVGTPTPQEPQFKRPIGLEHNYPVIGSSGQPNIVAPNRQQANFDMSQPTKFAFTYPTASYLEQQTMYFPDEQSLRNFAAGQRTSSIQSTSKGATATGYLKQYKKGGKMKMANNGLQIENNAYTPISDEVLRIDGSSHANGGTDLVYGNKGVEAEAGETFHIDQEGNGIIMGNMKNPLTGKKFKQDSKMLAKKEKKVDKLLDYSTELVTNSNPYDKWDALKFNAGEAMMVGAHMKKQELQRSRQHLTDLQEAMLALKSEGEEMSPSKKEGRKEAKKGLKINPTEKAQMGMRIPFQLGKKKAAQTAVVNPLEEAPVNSNLSVAQRHNNPGNMKYEPWMSKFGATPGQPDKITGDGTTYAQFPDMQSGMSAMREKLFNRPTYSNLDLKTAINKWTGGHPYANIPQDLAGKKLSEMTDAEKERAFSVITMGEDSKVYNRTQPGGTATKPLESQTYIPQDIHFNPRVAPKFAPQPVEKQKGGPNSQYEYNWNLNETPEPYVGTDAEPLQFQQILPEIYAAATNKQEPVWMQQYNPQLFQDYEISLQDRRNQITSQGRATRQYLSDNAGAQAILAAGEYDALNQVGAEEFRLNQQISNDITNKNISLLNDAQTTNLRLADQQYTRQALGKSKTKAANQTILNSLSNKVLQNQLENRTLQVYENMYPHFRYNDQYQQEKVGLGGGEYLNTGVPALQPSQTNYTSTTKTFDGSGTLKQTKQSNPSIISSAIQRLRKEELERKNLQKLFNNSK